MTIIFRLVLGRGHYALARDKRRHFQKTYITYNQIRPIGLDYIDRIDTQDRSYAKDRSIRELVALAL